jgi:hypothetical protein
MNKVFSDDGWTDYLHWQKQDKKTLKRSNANHKLEVNIEKLDVYRAAMEYVVWAYPFCEALAGRACWHCLQRQSSLLSRSSHTLWHAIEQNESSSWSGFSSA